MKEILKVKINFKGGIVSPGVLYNVLDLIKNYGIKEVKFGLRQQMIFDLPSKYCALFEATLNEMSISYSYDEARSANLISSYVAEEVFKESGWLGEGIYKDIFDSFEEKTKYKVNISDKDQSFSPFFTGHVNFISSEEPNFWYLYIRLPKSNELIIYNKLIYSLDLAKIYYHLEAKFDTNDLEDLLESFPSLIVRPLLKHLELPTFNLPYYEGFNRYGRKTWLGIYRRNETFRISFLQELCKLSLATKIGEICLTPWKSLIIKNIKESDRLVWSGLLSKNNINVRHAAIELNWQIEDGKSDAINLKNRLVAFFNKSDLRTFGICLGIKTSPKTEVYSSILVRRRAWKYLPLINVFDITYTTDFNPNGRKVAYFARSIFSYALPSQVEKAVLMFNNKIGSPEEVDQLLDSTNEVSKISLRVVNQCPQCLTVYDHLYGDSLNDIEPGVLFKDLPSFYTCSICETPKNEFTVKKM